MRRSERRPPLSPEEVREDVLDELAASHRSVDVSPEAIDALVKRALEVLRPHQIEDFFFTPNPWFGCSTALAMLCYGRIAECFAVLDAWDEGEPLSSR
jgi:hypothetical protein